LVFNKIRDCYVAQGLVANIGNETSHFEICSKFEIVNEYEAIPEDETNRLRLKRNIKKYPLGREILTNRSFYDLKIGQPVLSILNIALGDMHEIAVADMDIRETVCLKEPTYMGEAEIEPNIIETKGLEMPTKIYESAKEAIELESFPEHVRPFIRDIFVDKYPQAVSLHALNAGNLSKTLGYVKLRLREGEVLPRSKRIFHLSLSDKRHLEDICELMTKFGYIQRAPISPTGHHLYGMSSYLVPRAKPGCLGRLIVDFSPINQLIESPPSVIPEITATLQFLHGKALYTSLDLRYAYLSLRMDNMSRPLTTFLTPSGSYQWLSIPTAAANSPAYFTEAAEKILHFDPVRDEEGEIVYEEPNKVKLIKNPLKYSTSFFDDILITSTLQKTYEETLKVHFKNVEEAISKLAFHGAKISVPKCEFAKPRIKFLGWIVSHDYVVADPARIQKVKDFMFPDSKKSVRAFLGLVNSLRRVVQMDVIEQVAILTPLTSSKIDFEPKEKHIKAFEKIKALLIQEPLYNKLIDEKAPKYLWVDAAGRCSNKLRCFGSSVSSEKCWGPK